MTTPDFAEVRQPQTVGPQRFQTTALLWPEKPTFSLFSSSRASSVQRLHLKYYGAQTSWRIRPPEISELTDLAKTERVQIADRIQKSFIPSLSQDYLNVRGRVSANVRDF